MARSSFSCARAATRVRYHVRVSHLPRSIPRHFTLRRACYSFEVYEIGCASPLTGSTAKRRDEFLRSLFVAFFLPPSAPPPFFFNFPVKGDLVPSFSQVYESIPETDFSFSVGIARFAAVNPETSLLSLTVAFEQINGLTNGLNVPLKSASMTASILTLRDEIQRDLN